MTELLERHIAEGLSDLCAAHSAFSPPSARTVAEGAARSLIIKQPGTAGGPWAATDTPYMIEPMNLVTSRAHEACIFVGPARCGKTLALLLAPMTHVVLHDPGDMLFIQMSQDKAREFSKTDIRRAVDYSPDLKSALSGNASDRNTHDIMFRNGVWLRIAWPTVSNVSGATYRFGFITDYDRIENCDNVDGEGPLFDLVRKRVATFMSRGFALAESSPGIEMQDPHWSPRTPHEGPPLTGIVGLYNRGDRRRWYWRCHHCGDWFCAAPGLSLFGLPNERELAESIRDENIPQMAKHYAKRIICPSSGCIISAKEKPRMNNGGIWVPDGCSVTGERELVGDIPAGRIASYWLGGVAAAFQTWESLVLRYLQAFRDYTTTGDVEALKSTVTLDQGAVFVSPALSADAEDKPESRAEDLPRYIAPDWTRFLIGTADVQGGANSRFVCTVRAFGEGLQSCVVDRFSLTSTERGGESSQVDPAGHPEDWDLLTTKLVTATYRLNNGKEMRILRVGVDTGGEAGVTHNAYAWFRRLRHIGKSSSVRLLKGGSHAQERPVVRANARDTRGNAMHDLPLWLIDTDHFKDIIHAQLRRKVPGPGYFHPSKWLPQAFWDELRSEARDAKGRWSKLRARNEELDLWVMALACVEELGFGAKTSYSWETPPAWALPIESGNTMVIDAEERREEQKRAIVKQPAKRPPRPVGRDW